MAKVNYTINLPDNVGTILDQDFWVLENLDGSILKSANGPIKFTSTVSIFIKTGSAEAEINLIRYNIKAPCILNINAGQIIQISNVSDDFSASFLVMSKRMVDNLFMYMNHVQMASFVQRPAVAPLLDDEVSAYVDFYARMRNLVSEKDNPFCYQAILFGVMAFFYKDGWRPYERAKEATKVIGEVSSPTRITDMFLKLLEEHCRDERFLDFYADKLEISTKHLSRSVKKATGYTAAEWIERYIVLEAKVLLKWSTMTIQQISDELNFPSQSFFGKYFKKNVGLSPKEFRNNL